MALWAEFLAGTLIVARWFQRIGTNSDIGELRQVMDWLGKAFLFAQLQTARFKQLRDTLGVRTARQLEAAVAPGGEALDSSLQAQHFDAAQMLALLRRDPCYLRANQLVERMRLL